MGAPGCDDAPLIAMARGTIPHPVTLIVPYYENPNFLAYQLKYWRSMLPLHILEQLSVIVIDDGSPDHLAEEILQAERDLRLFRIDIDVRWNWLAARNIGMYHAAEGWCILTDIDHVVPYGTFEAAIYGLLDEGMIYRFSRREHDGKAIHPHPNSWLMTRAMFWKIGGYDETLSGHYGTDGEYRRRCAATAPIRILMDELVRHEHQGDSSTVRYLRKQPIDAAVKKLIAARPKKGWKPKVLSFPYHEVKLRSAS